MLHLIWSCLLVTGHFLFHVHITIYVVVLVYRRHLLSLLNCSNRLLLCVGSLPISQCALHQSLCIALLSIHIYFAPAEMPLLSKH